MYNLEKSLGMCSDRPGTTPKSLDLVVSPTCLRERESFWRFGAGWWGKEKGTSYISQAARLHLSVQARTARDIHADRPLMKFLTHPTGTSSGKFFPTKADCPRTYGGPSAPCSLANHQCIRSLPDEPIISGLSAVLCRMNR